jgi:uncharacterized cupin superfamily protein
MAKNQNAFLMRADDIAKRAETTLTHHQNPNAVRHTRTLTDALGFEDMGVHIVRVAPGADSSEHHFHEEDEEFLFVLSGRAIAYIGEDEFEIGAGDFMGFPKNSPPHYMHNPFDDDVVYLMGGTRAPIDICNYPRLERRQFRIHGAREWASTGDLRKLTKPGEKS